MKALEVTIDQHEPGEPLEQGIHRQHVNPLASGVPGVSHQSDDDAVVDVKLTVHEQAAQIPMLGYDDSPHTALALDPYLELRNGNRSPFLVLESLLLGKLGGPLAIGLVRHDDIWNDCETSQAPDD